MDQIKTNLEENMHTPPSKNKIQNIKIDDENINLINMYPQKTDEIQDENKSNTKIKTLYIHELETISESSVNSSIINQSLINQEKNSSQKKVNKSNYNSKIILKEKLNFDTINKENVLLKEENDILKANIQVLNEKIQFHQNQISKITKMNKNYESTIDKMNNEISMLNNKLKEKEKIISDYENKISKINELMAKEKKDKNILIHKQKLYSDLSINNNIIENNFKIKRNSFSKNSEINKNLNTNNFNNYCFSTYVNSIPKNIKEQINSSAIIYDINQYNKNKNTKNISIKNLKSNYIFKNYFSNNISNKTRNEINKENHEMKLPNSQKTTATTFYHKKGVPSAVHELNKSNTHSNIIFLMNCKNRNRLDINKNNEAVSCTEMMDEKNKKKINKSNSLLYKIKPIENINNPSNNNINKDFNFKKLNINYKKYFCNHKDNSNLNKYVRKKLNENDQGNLTNNNTRRYNFEKENFDINNLNEINKNGNRTQKEIYSSKSNTIMIFNNISKLRRPKTHGNKLNFHNLTSLNNFND